MQVVSEEEACEDFDAVFEKVLASRSPLIITRERGENVVIISAEEWAEIKAALRSSI